MEFQKCARCKKRPAAVYITRIDKDKTINEGLCLVCAKELGIKPVDDILRKMGVTEEDLENMMGEMNELMSSDETSLEPKEDGLTDGGAPAIDFQKLFS